MERQLSSASAIILNTPEATAVFRAAFPRLSDKEILTITNGFDAHGFEIPAHGDRHTTFSIVHAGGMLPSAATHGYTKYLHRLLRGTEMHADLFTRSPAFLLQAVDRWCEMDPAV